MWFCLTDTIDLLNLPRCGPKPSLRPETNITVKLMDDLQLPAITAQQQQALPPAPISPTEYQPPVLRTRPPVQNYQYQQQSYPAYPYRNPPPPYYSYPRVGAFAFVARVARYYPHTFDRE